MDPDLAAAFDDELFARSSALSGLRRWPTQLHIGHPTRSRCTLDPTDPHLVDQAVRAIELIPEVRGLTAWLSRMSHVDALDEIAHGAISQAFATYRIPLHHFVVMDHDSWVDLISGNQHSWYRVRPNRRQFRDVPALGVGHQDVSLDWVWEGSTTHSGQV